VAAARRFLVLLVINAIVVSVAGVLGMRGMLRSALVIIAATLLVNIAVALQFGRQNREEATNKPTKILVLVMSSLFFVAAVVQILNLPREGLSSPEMIGAVSGIVVSALFLVIGLRMGSKRRA